MSETLPNDGFEHRKVRNGYMSIEAVCPHDGKIWDVYLSLEKAKWVTSNGMGATLELAETVRDGLRNPRRIFRGVRDDDREIDDDGWLCYISRPSVAYDRKRHVKVPAWDNEVFMIYVTDERVVYHWGWYACDNQDPDLPVDYENRFKKPVF